MLFRSPAFAGEHSLLSTDQGIRAIHSLFNAVFQHDPDAFKLQSWELEGVIEELPSEDAITHALKTFEELETANTALESISEAVINKFDWRLSSAPGLTEMEKKVQGAYRGSSGYSLLLKDLIKVLSDDDSSPMIQSIAKEIGYHLIKKK